MMYIAPAHAKGTVGKQYHKTNIDLTHKCEYEAATDAVDIGSTELGLISVLWQGREGILYSQYDASITPV